MILERVSALLLFIEIGDEVVDNDLNCLCRSCFNSLADFEDLFISLFVEPESESHSIALDLREPDSSSIHLVLLEIKCAESVDPDFEFLDLFLGIISHLMLLVEFLD